MLRLTAEAACISHTGFIVRWPVDTFKVDHDTGRYDLWQNPSLITSHTVLPQIVDAKVDC